MVAVREIIREEFEVRSGDILGPNGQILGYNVIDASLDPSDSRYIVKTFDTASGAQNYNNQINSQLRLDPKFDPRVTVAPGATATDNPDAAPDSNNNVTRRPPIGDWDLDDDKMIRYNVLTRQEKRTLKNTGQILIGGFNYTQADFDAIETRWKNRVGQLKMKADLDADAAKRVAEANKRTLQDTTRGTRMVRAFIPNYFGISLALVSVLRNALIELQQEMIDGTLTPTEYNNKVDSAVGIWFTVTMLPYILRVVGGATIDAALRNRIVNIIGPSNRNRGNWRSFLGRSLMKNLGSYIGTRAVLDNETAAKFIAEAFKNAYIDDQNDHWFSLGYAASVARSLDKTIDREFDQRFIDAYKLVKGAIEPTAPADETVVDQGGEPVPQGDGNDDGNFTINFD